MIRNPILREICSRKNLILYSIGFIIGFNLDRIYHFLARFFH